MEKHVTLVGVLHIVYSSFGVIGAAVLFLLAGGMRFVLGHLYANNIISPLEVPPELMHLIPFILLVAGFFVALRSVAGILGAIWLLKYREWARILMLVLSFFSLVNIPIGTLLGGYSIWVLMKDETIRLFSPRPVV